MRMNHCCSKPALLLMGCILLSLLTACNAHWQPHSRREVLTFIKTEFPGMDITVAEDYTHPTWENGKQSPFRVWDCWYNDLPEVIFHVESSYPTGHPAPLLDYSLHQDSATVFWTYYLETYQAGVGSLDLWHTDAVGNLRLSFSSMTNVSQAAEQLRDFYSWYEAQPHAGQPHSAICCLEGLPLPSGSMITDFIYLNTPTTLANNPQLNFVHDTAKLEELCAQAIKTYYSFYHLSSPDFSGDEITSFSQQKWALSWTEGESRSTVPYLYRDGNPIPAEFFSGIGLQPYAGSGLQYSCISYGGLYELLTRLGMAPVGETKHFTVTGADSSLYEFSYDFTDTDHGKTVWYHTKDGKPVKRTILGECGGAPFLRVSSDTFQAVTGLEFRKPAQ